MIKHIVCFKLKNNSPEECEKAKEILLSMQGKVPELRGITVGVDFLHSERSYDLILEVLLDNAADLESYQNDPYHCSVVKKHMHSVRESSVAVDYEIGE
ncbi:MAG: Dabb family protein [Oscillospiraceae bacterium]|nr:Dabb family protein [Oscillospiraceae bacterium]